MLRDKTNKQMIRLMRALMKMGNRERVGVARYLGIELGMRDDNDNLTLKDGEEILLEVFNKFESMTNHQRIKLLRLVENAAAASVEYKEVDMQMAADKQESESDGA